jgi:hypothetical protein
MFAYLGNRKNPEHVWWVHIAAGPKIQAISIVPSPWDFPLGLFLYPWAACRGLGFHAHLKGNVLKSLNYKNKTFSVRGFLEVISSNLLNFISNNKPHLKTILYGLFQARLLIGRYKVSVRNRCYSHDAYSLIRKNNLHKQNCPWTKLCSISTMCVFIPVIACKPRIVCEAFVQIREGKGLEIFTVIWWGNFIPANLIIFKLCLYLSLFSFQFHTNLFFTFL